jgi:catechol 2,3-dioxygenase-like lactoylglutathione lyase family enzyme
MASTLAQNVFQIGFVVPDIHKGMAFFKDKLGVPEFLFIEKPELQDETYLGKPAPLRLHLAFGWCGDTQVELIQPIAGTSTYSKFLDHNPQGGMHHYGIEVPDYGKGVREMEAGGFALVQGGRHIETRFAYFDTTGTIGALTEIVYLQPEEKAFMISSGTRNESRIRRVASGAYSPSPCGYSTTLPTVSRLSMARWASPTRSSEKPPPRTTFSLPLVA